MPRETEIKTRGGCAVSHAVETCEAALPAGPGCGPGRRWRVLLVDDEECVLSSLRRLLRREPYDLISANSAEEALDVLAARPADLVVSDQRMAGRSGVSLLREIRERWPETVRIILSGYADVTSLIDAVNEGAVYKFVSKPWNDDELRLHLRRALEGAGIEQQNRQLAREVAAQNERLAALNRELEQRAGDASLGLTLTQSLIEDLEAGLLVVDAAGQIVLCNRIARTLVPGVMTGADAVAALPHPLGGTGGAVCSGEGEASLGAVRVAWRARAIELAGGGAGTAVTLWARSAPPAEGKPTC